MRLLVISWTVGGERANHDSSLHLAIFSRVIGTVSQQSQLTFFGYEPAGEFSISVAKQTMTVCNLEY